MTDVAINSPIPPRILTFFNPLHPAKGLYRRRELIINFAKREFFSRYRGSYLGFFWSFLQPLLMMSVYSFIFVYVLRVQTTGPLASNPAAYPLLIYCGLIFFNVAAECISRAPTLIVANTNLVKKVIFPLEILPVSLLGAALIHASVSVAILLLAVALLLHTLSLYVLLLPVVLFPLILACLSMGWLLGALGPFIRDLGQLIAIVLQVLTFMTPIFYDISAIPPRYQWFAYLNPLWPVIEGAKRILVEGRGPEWTWLLSATSVLLVLALTFYALFMKSKRAFADVL